MTKIENQMDFFSVSVHQNSNLMHKIKDGSAKNSSLLQRHLRL